MNVPQRDQMAFPSIGPIGDPAGASPRVYNEEVVTGAAWILWRKRWWLAGGAAVALCLATLYLAVAPKEYLGEAVIRLDFELSEAGTGSRVSIEAASLADSEVRIVRSRALAEKVVKRLQLADDPAFSGHPGLIGGIIGWFSALGDEGGPHLESKMQNPSRRAEARAASTLLANTTIESGSKSYLISVRFRSNSPDTAASMANMIVQEYFRERQYQDLFALSARLRAQVAQLSEQYGDKHPALLAAQLRLDKVQRGISEEEQRAGDSQHAAPRSVRLQNLTAELAIPAAPPLSPASPNPLIVYPLSLALGLGTITVLLLLHARRSNGLANETEAERVLGMRCFGVVPAQPKYNSQKEWVILFEAVGTIGVEAGLDIESPSCKVAVITSSLPDEDKSLFTSTLAFVAAESGRNVLVLNCVPQAQTECDTIHCNEESAGDTSENFVGAPVHPRISFGTLYPAFSNQEAERYIRNARESYNLIIIKGPPVLLTADTARLARLSDTVMLLVKWRKTPQHAVARAARLLREAGVHIKGAVLTGVDLPQQRLEWVRDRSYYLSKYQEFFLSVRRWSKASNKREEF